MATLGWAAFSATACWFSFSARDDRESFSIGVDWEAISAGDGRKIGAALKGWSISMSDCSSPFKCWLSFELRLQMDFGLLFSDILIVACAAKINQIVITHEMIYVTAELLTGMTTHIKSATVMFW